MWGHIYCITEVKETGLRSWYEGTMQEAPVPQAFVRSVNALALHPEEMISLERTRKNCPFCILSGFFIVMYLAIHRARRRAMYPMGEHASYHDGSTRMQWESQMTDRLSK